MEPKKGIHLIKRDHPGPDQGRVPTARLQKYGFVADIILSNKEPGHIYHYVIQPEGSKRIVHWGQELSFKRALDSVEAFFEPYRKSFRRA